eukprot:3087630-Rhodomonas_salina.1
MVGERTIRAREKEGEEVDSKGRQIERQGGRGGGTEGEHGLKGEERRGRTRRGEGLTRGRRP